MKIQSIVQGWRTTRGSLVGTVLALASLCGACRDGQVPCWGLEYGSRLSLELVDSYTNGSPYTYESVASNTWPQTRFDQFPSCGADFDFHVGESLHVTALTRDLGQDEGASSCWPSEMRIDQPVRIDLTSALPKNPNLSSNLAGALPVVLWTTENITVNGCPAQRLVSVVPHPQSTYPGSWTAPEPGTTPPLILVRSAASFASGPGPCAEPTPGCADQFVVRVTRD